MVREFGNSNTSETWESAFAEISTIVKQTGEHAMNLWNGRCGLFVGLSLIVLSGPALALVVTQDATETLFGVDSAGSPSEDNGGTGTGKIYKDTMR